MTNPVESVNWLPSQILQFVSGVPSPAREKRLLLMLQVMIDESQSHSSPRVFVLAGYVATAEQWARFTDAWHAALRFGGPRALDYFSYREAFPRSGRPRGQFHTWTLEERDALVGLLRRIIEDHVLAEVCVGFNVDAYEKAFSGLKDLAKNPYYISTSMLETSLAKNMEKVGLHRGPLQFIYDEKKVEESKILDAWYCSRERAIPDPPDLLDVVLTTAPMFRGSRDVIALQAADLFAGWVRQYNENIAAGPEMPGFTRMIPSIMVTMTDEMLRAKAERIAARNAGRAAS